jgi:hypothetical protein
LILYGFKKMPGTSGITITRSRVRTRYPEQNGKVLYCGSNLANAANSILGGPGRLDVLLFDHNLTLNGSEITNCGPGSSISAADVSLSYSAAADCYNFDKKRVVGWCGRNDSPQGYKLAVYGHKAPMPDAALRYLDTGVSVDSSFFMEVRSQLGGEIRPMDFDDTNQLPLKSAYTPTDQDISVTTFEESEVLLVNGVMDIAYYSYSDPEYTAPAATGDANLVFYEGNSSVQRVSVERSFEPALLVIANRAASHRQNSF